MTTAAPLPARVTSLRELARVLDCGISTIYKNKWRENGMPVNNDGSYDPAKIREWRAALTKANCRTRGPESIDPRGKIDDDGQQSLTELRRLKVLREQLAYDRERGLLVEKDELVNLLVARASEFKRELFGRARRLARDLVGLPQIEIQVALEEDARRILDKYARSHDDDNADEEAEADAAVPGGAEDAGAAEEDDGEPVGRSA